MQLMKQTKANRNYMKYLNAKKPVTCYLASRLV